jgi:hypothetical protein
LGVCGFANSEKAERGLTFALGEFDYAFATGSFTVEDCEVSVH